jgi:heptosyltransferase-2
VHSILILKTGALGDVLRTTSILPGLREAYPDAVIEWVTAPQARQLVEGHPALERVHPCDLGDAGSFAALRSELVGRSWDWVISLDDEIPLCALASELGASRLSGAHLDSEGRQTYSEDAAPWFDMGLLSRLGKDAADQLKLENRRSHPEILSSMLGVSMGRPELALPSEAEATAGALFAGASALPRPWIGLNTGAGGRWISKQLPEERVVELGRELHGALGGEVGLVLLGGLQEGERNARIRVGLEAVRPSIALLDAGVDHSLLDFAAIVDRLDLLITSDSLALHVAVARCVPLVAFFAPTSAAEIELYGLGAKLLSEAPDYCSYRPDADNRSLTAARLVAAALGVLNNRPGA